MNRRNWLKSLSIVALAAALPIFPSHAAESLRPAPAKKDLLSVGETRRFANDLKITFLAVKKDTRCPINARCISAGDAEIILRVKAGKNPAKRYHLHTNGKPRHITVSPNDSPDDPLKFHRISIARLTPDRMIGKPLKQSDYRLKLSIATAIE